MPPVIHVDTDAPLYLDVDKSLITDKLWGIYYKARFSLLMVFKVEHHLIKLVEPGVRASVDPYGPKSSELLLMIICAYVTSALAFCHKRFEGKSHLFKKK